MTGTVLVDKELLLGTVPVNKDLLTGTVPVNKDLLAGTVPINKELLTGRVQVNNLFLIIIVFCLILQMSIIIILEPSLLKVIFRRFSLINFSDKI